jgi:hypothetical protein
MTGSEAERAWDEITDMQLDGEVEHTDADAVAQRKRPDAWAVHWAKRCLLILEFTRPNDRDVLALQNTDTLKTVRYTPLRVSARQARDASSGLGSGNTGLHHGNQGVT